MSESSESPVKFVNNYSHDYIIKNNGYFTVKIEDAEEPQKCTERLTVSNYDISSIKRHKKHYDVSLENVRGDLYYHGVYMNVSYIFMCCRDQNLKIIDKMFIVTEEGSVFEYEKPEYKFTVL